MIISIQKVETKEPFSYLHIAIAQDGIVQCARRQWRVGNRTTFGNVSCPVPMRFSINDPRRSTVMRLIWETSNTWGHVRTAWGSDKNIALDHNLPKENVFLSHFQDCAPLKQPRDHLLVNALVFMERSKQSDLWSVST
jgi:hypothetical protein